MCKLDLRQRNKREMVRSGIVFAKGLSHDIDVLREIRAHSPRICHSTEHQEAYHTY
jgi:hypothetical protein